MQQRLTKGQSRWCFLSSFEPRSIPYLFLLLQLLSFIVPIKVVYHIIDFHLALLVLKHIEEGTSESKENIGTTAAVVRFGGEKIVDGGNLREGKKLCSGIAGKLDNGFDGVLPNGGELTKEIGKACFHRLNSLVTLLQFQFEILFPIL